MASGFVCFRCILFYSYFSFEFYFAQNENTIKNSNNSSNSNNNNTCIHKKQFYGFEWSVCLSVSPPIFFCRVSFKTFIIVIMIIVLCSFFLARTTNNCVVFVVFVRFLLLSFTLRAAHTCTQIQHMDILFD